MLEAELDPENEHEIKLEKDSEENENPHDLQMPKKLLEDEIINNSVLFLLAGFETTSTTLALASFLLAVHPEKQQKLLQEIDENFPTLVKKR